MATSIPGLSRFRLLAAGAACFSLLPGCASQGGITTGSLALTPPKTYVLSPVEKNWHCGALENAVHARITTITKLTEEAKIAAESTAPTISAVFARTFGKPGDDNPALAQIPAERAAANAYNAALAGKSCQTVDIDANLARGIKTVETGPFVTTATVSQTASR